MWPGKYILLTSSPNDFFFSGKYGKHNIITPCCSECYEQHNWSFSWKTKNILLKSNKLATWCKELTHWERPWCWERLRAGVEGDDDRGWDGCMALLTQWTWVWVDSVSWWWTGRPGVLRFMGSQSWTWLSGWTELNWTEHMCVCMCAKSLQLYPILWDSVDCRLPGSSIHGILQAKILEWVAMPFSRGWNSLLL